MTPELKAQWLDALRSGRFKQGAGALNFGGRHCCLGVLCEVAGLKALPRSDGMGKGYDAREYIAPGSSTIMRLWISDPKFADQIGLPDAIASLAMRLNDDGKSFNEIADHLETAL